MSTLLQPVSDGNGAAASTSTKERARSLLASRYTTGKPETFQNMVDSISRELGSGWEKWLSPHNQRKFSILKSQVAGPDKNTLVDAQTKTDFLEDAAAHKPRRCCMSAMVITSFFVAGLAIGYLRT